MNDHAAPHWNDPSPLPDRKPPMPEATLTPNEYQRRAKATAIYRKNIESMVDAMSREEIIDLFCKLYCTLGAMDELGELASIYKRFLRDGTPIQDVKVLAELGDKEWYNSMHAEEYGEPFGDVLATNLDKLSDRAERGGIKGEGDERRK